MKTPCPAKILRSLLSLKMTDSVFWNYKENNPPEKWQTRQGSKESNIVWFAANMAAARQSFHHTAEAAVITSRIRVVRESVVDADMFVIIRERPPF